MSSPGPPPPPRPPPNTFLDHPYVNTATGYIVQLQRHPLLTKERLRSVRQSVLVTIGFLVLLYCLIHIQILFFWLVRLVFRLALRVLVSVFWLPLKTVRWLIPKSIDYDILFPLFWLCSVASFYLSKFSHEHVCQLFDQWFVQRYKLFSYDQIKREDARRYLFVGTFVVFLLLQCLFILMPIALAIRQQHTQPKLPSTPVIATTTTTTTTPKSPVKNVVETMSGNLYKRFIDAFTDENEAHMNGKRAPLVSDEQLEQTFKSIKNGLKTLKATGKPEDEKKGSRFQRWVMHYLKAPFQKWEGPPAKTLNSNERQEEEEKDMELRSSSSLSDDDDDDDEDENEDDDVSDSDDDDEDSQDDEHATIAERIQQQLDRVKDVGEKIRDSIASKVSSSSSNNDNDDEEEEEDDDLQESRVAKSPSSIVSDDEEEDQPSTAAKLTEQAKEVVETVAARLKEQVRGSTDGGESGYESDDGEGSSPGLADRIKDTLAEPLGKARVMTGNVKDKIATSLEEVSEASASVAGHVQDALRTPIENAQELGEKVVANVRSKLPSASDLDRVKEAVVKPIDTTVTNLREKVSGSKKKLAELSLADRADKTMKKAVKTTRDKLASGVDEVKHQAEELLDFAVRKASKVRKTLPKADKVVAKVKHDVVKPVEAKAAKVKKAIQTKTDELKTTVVDKVKSLKKEKKPKTLGEKAKEKAQALASAVQKRLPGHVDDELPLPRGAHFLSDLDSHLHLKSKLNGWFDEAWNVWHLATVSLSHIFTHSTKHARHLPRYNTTSLYTAYTDLKCYNYTKQWNRFRVGNARYQHFLDSYRRHSPFPVYLSVLKSHGPKCYRRYPDSSCALVAKTRGRNFKVQLFRFVRFWTIIGVIVTVLSVLYKYLTACQTAPSSHFRRSDDSDRSADAKQTTTSRYDQTVPTTTPYRTTSGSPIAAPSAGRPVDANVEKQLREWLRCEQNDGFRNLSEACRLAINSTFERQLEQLSVETLQFANAKIRDVSQNNHNNNSSNRSAEATAEKIIINAVLDIDHLILNIVNAFKEQHFSLETRKLSGQLHIVLLINPNQYSIEAALQQLQFQPVNVIDPNRALSENEKQAVVKLLDETINRTTVRYTFRLSENQEHAATTTTANLYNSSSTSRSEKTKTPTSPTQISISSTATTASRSPQPNAGRYQPPESIPTLLVNDARPHSYASTSAAEQEPKKLLVRVVKAVKLHNVEQPYCTLELNHPKQFQQTRVAESGVNPFWDERFLFDCDDRSNQIHLQIIDRKKTSSRTSNGFVDTVYADALIPFSYATSTVYKQDIQISPQFPESILRLEFSTLSEEEALAVNNGFDVESLTDSQTWTYNDREASRIEQEYPHRYQQSASNDYLTSSYDAGSLPKHYGLSPSLYDDERDYASTLPRSLGSPFPPSTPRDGNGPAGDKPQKSKSFMSSLKHLTLPRRKQNKNKYDSSMGSQTNSVSQLNTHLQSPTSNLTSHSLSSEYFLPQTMEHAPIRRSRSISQSFKNLFRSSSKKKALAAKADALGEFENGSHSYASDSRSYLSTSVPTSKKLSFLQRRKSKQKSKNQSSNSLSSYDHSRMESVRDTPIRANVGHPVTMTKSPVR